MFFVFMSLASFITACGLTWLFRVYAIHNKILDIPVHRSAHTTPVPRGGGVAIVITTLIFISLCFFLNLISREIMLAFILPGLLIAIIGFLDDRGHIDAKLRLVFHFIAAGLGIYFIGGFPTVLVAGYNVNMPIVGTIFGLLFLVWMLNLYNFMDGINGIAGSEAVSFAALSLLIIGLAQPQLISFDKSLPLLILSSASVGFLLWNFPVARIFMGDAGSGFLGIIIGLLVLFISHADARLFLSELILLGVFIVDATVTLLRRVIRGQKPFEAHASHCYQIMSRHYQSHTKVTLSVIAINVLWLAPFSWAAASSRLDGVVALIIAWLPLIVLAWRYGAGVKDKVKI